MTVPYELVWLPVADRPGLAERFFVPDFRGELPFLLPADAAAALPPAPAVPGTLTEEQLLHGLFGTFAERDPDGFLVARATDTEVMLELFEVLRQGFGFESRELMVLETSGILRARYGVQPSQACLCAGRLLVPDSQQIRADLMLDLWVASGAATEVGDPELAVHYRRLIPELFEGLVATSVPPKTYELCVYLNFAARALRDDFIEAGSLEAFLVDDVIEKITDARLKAQLKHVFDVVRADGKLAFEDFELE